MTEIFQNRALADKASDTLKVYAQPQRLMVLSFLLRGENTVSNIDEATGIGQPALSQQLAALRRADIVKTRRDGKQIWYDLTDERARLCVKTLQIILNEEPDRRKLIDATMPDRSATPPLKSPAGTARFAKIL